MSRPLRIEYPGAWYHVMNRGQDREEIFRTEEDHQIFIDLLKESTHLWKVKIIAYCLMPNHYHVLINTPLGNLSRSLRHINGIYTQKYNRLHKKDGPIFRGRYKSILIEKDAYLLELVRYIHKNPLKAGIVDRLTDYKWSSHKDYITDSRKTGWLDKESVFNMLTGKEGQRVSAYRGFISDKSESELYKTIEGKKTAPILGSSQFIEKLKKQHRMGKQEEVPETKLLLPAPEKIIEAVGIYYKTTKEDILKSRRGQANEPRNVAVYMCRRLRGDTLRDIGNAFKIKKYSTVSTIIVRMNENIEKEKAINKSIKGVLRLLNMSQEQT